MWFKNLRIYRLTQAFTQSPEQLAEALEAFAFQPCGNLDSARLGWVAPLGRSGTELVHATNGNIMVCQKRQEKILPAAVVREHLEDRIAAIQEEEGRPVGRSERDGLKDEVIFSLLPRALTKSTVCFAYIAPKENLVYVNASSAKRAEELLSGLREALGSLPLSPLVGVNPPVSAMTHWVRESQPPAPFTLQEECELQAPKDGRVIRCKNQDLSADELLSHVHSGMVVNKLALSWKEAIHFVLDDQLAVKRLKFDDKLLEIAGERQPDSVAETFDADFAIMATELKQFSLDLLLALGGEA
ncbi:recombination-associated protein RdgC [Teredinibacter waterburyi]|jgi:DNA recombination-dependent growth factor C|uniref:recombination-associated protein RdgC n=1 Tax=Teredinibacter waterburyi TaxID=1500538 RepID=UPI00165F61E1|nr:recombination-associated protein RdgC [Teredinibacter waterburyi]